MRKYVLILLGVGLIYSLGVISYRNNLEPIKSLKKFKNTIIKYPKMNNEEFYKIFVENETTHFKSLFDSVNPKETRNKILKQLIIEDYEIVRTQTNFDCYEDVEIIETKFYNLKNRGVYKNRDKKKLFIYFQGHGGNPCDFDYYKNLYSGIEEFDFLTFSMFGRGFNKTNSIGFPIKLPNHKSSYEYNSDGYSELGTHDIIQFFFDKDHPELIPLSLFVSSPYHIINDVIKSKEYDEIVISGISGGGWYSTILSGLIPEINQLYSFNGTLPFVYRIGTDSNGDYEQQFSKLWEKHDYYTFYLLSLFDNNNTNNRISYHLYSKDDECCFSYPEVHYFKNTIDSLNYSNLKVKIFDKYEHEIDEEWLIKKISN